MRIQHNIPAMNAYRNYNANTKALQANLQKLSSGYKINKAGDDAAGLAISEKMRAQITGLEVAQKNAKDGISLVQTAEGAMTEIHTMLNRMFSLAEQSANGTYNDKVDREQLQSEFDALRTEIDRIAQATNFNGQALLDGTLGKVKSDTNTQEVIPEFEGSAATNACAALNGDPTVSYDANITDDNKKLFNTALENLTVTVTITAAASNAIADSSGGGSDSISINAGGGTADGVTWTFTATNNSTKAADGTSATFGPGANINQAADLILTGKLADGTVLGTVNLGTISEADIASGAQTSTFTFSEPPETSDKAEIATLDPTAATDYGVASIDLTGATVALDTDANIAYDGTTLSVEIGDKTFSKDVSGVTPTGGDVLELDDGTGNKIKVTLKADAADIKVGTGKAAINTGNPTKIGTTSEAAGESKDGLRLRVGDSTEDYDNIYVDIKSMKKGDLEDITEGTGKKLKDLSIAKATGEEGGAHADTAMKALKGMINYVSNERGKLGATQNRLDHTINNLSTMQENIQDAEATIRDVDVAEEMMKYTKNNILVQSAQAMLAQANQLPQGVLQLLG